MDKFNLKKYLAESKLLKENQYTYMNDNVLDMDYDKIRAYISTKKGDEFADDFIDGYNDDFYENVVRFFDKNPTPTDEEVLNFVDIEIEKEREKYIPAPNAPGGIGLKEDLSWSSHPSDVFTDEELDMVSDTLQDMYDTLDLRGEEGTDAVKSDALFNFIQGWFETLN